MAASAADPSAVSSAAAAAVAGLVAPTIDTSRKFYHLKVHGENFHIDERYKDLTYIASGAYGFVAAATDSVTGRKVAIKKVRDTFRNLTDAKRILRELKLLRHLGGHENIIWILDIMVYPNQRDFKDLYIVTDLMESDLGRIIDSSQTLSDSHIKYFLYQILRGLKYIHSAKILHRDLKPQNILVNSSCELVICDFGLARSTIGTRDEDPTMDDNGEPTEDSGAGVAANLTVYVVTRWYRAPELLMGSNEYGGPVDVWSVGCILAEILGRRPLFRGSNYMHQLQVIVEVLGSPTEEEMRFVKRKSARQAITSMGRREKVPFSKLYPRANPQATDLLDRMLHFDPAKRISVEDALAHPYLSDYHYPDDEPTAPRMVDVDFEKKGKMSKQELQMRMIREMNCFHPASEAGPETVSRLSETAAKLQVTGAGVVEAVGPTATDAETASAGAASAGDAPSAGSGGASGPPSTAGSGGDASSSAAPVDAAGDSGTSPSGEKILWSKTAKEDAEFEKAQKEARRIAQAARSKAALANLGARYDTTAEASPTLPDTPAEDVLSPSTQRAIELQFGILEANLTEKLTSHLTRAMAPFERRLKALEDSMKALQGPH